jgi:hypothetical protein
MSSTRLVEYFLVVGVDHGGKANNVLVGGEGAAVSSVHSSPVSPLSPLSEHTARGESACWSCGWLAS